MRRRRAALAVSAASVCLLVASPVHAAPPRARSAVVGGTQIPVAQAPWQVAIQAAIPTSKTTVEVISCSGSIIDISHVLTAGHCVVNAPPNQLIPAEDFTVLAGSSNTHELEEPDEFRQVSSVRVHPYYVYAPNSGRAEPDDVAVLTLSEPLVLSPDVNPIGLVPAGSYAPEGTTALFSGFGEQNPETRETNGKLYSAPLTLVYSRECGSGEGAQNALFVCAIGPSGSPCSGDSGSAMTFDSNEIGVLDDVTVLSGKSCTIGSRSISANLAAGEIQDFVQGSETPPHAPIGGGASCPSVSAVVGETMSCQPGTWSEAPAFTYQFVNSVSGQVVQSGPSSSYEFSGNDVGSSFYMQVLAVNAGGTGIDRTPSTTVVVPAPPSSHSSKTAPHITLPSAKISVHGAKAVVRLRCPAGRACRGTFKLTSRIGAGKHARTATLATGRFSLKAGKTGTVEVKLSSQGRAQLSAHGRLVARLTILQTQPAPKRTFSKSVHLVRAGKQSRPR